MNENVVKKLLKDYENIRYTNKILLEKRIKQVHEKFPDIASIDDNICKIGLNLTKSVLSNPNDKSKILYEAKSQIESLTGEKTRLMKNYNIPEDFLNIKYKCNICRDKAYLPNGEKCNCFKQKLINEAYKMSNLDNILQKENFSKFDVDIFSENKIEGQDMSPKESILYALSHAEKFVHEFDSSQSENLLFYGSTGLGKSFMCNCIAKSLLDKGYIVIYQTSFKILEILEDYKFRSNTRGISDENYKNLFDCDMLIIDDLGTELNNTFTSSEIFNIVNTRLITGKSVIISTNLTPEQIGVNYTQRTLSRILDKFRVIEFIGKDLRWERFN